VAELRIEPLGVTAVLASADACDRLTGPHVLRVAPREMLILGATDLGAVRDDLDDPTALIADVTDGWTAFVVRGAGAAEVFARLSELEAPAEGDWLQGEVAKTPAKVLARPDRLTILVPAHLAAHVEERIRTDAAEVLSA
jgi:hypothetical protein